MHQSVLGFSSVRPLEFYLSLTLCAALQFKLKKMRYFIDVTVDKTIDIKDKYTE